jgi:hypothetical protein
MTKEQFEAVLEKVRSWSEGEQIEFFEFAREIEARRTGVYALTDDERRSIETAEQSPFVSDAEVAAFWKKHGIS